MSNLSKTMSKPGMPGPRRDTAPGAGGRGKSGAGEPCVMPYRARPWDTIRRVAAPALLGILAVLAYGLAFFR